MRVLFWSELFWPHIGGAEIGGLQLISGLRKHGHSITVVTRHDEPSLLTREEHHGIPIFRFPFWKALADRNPAQLLKARQEVLKLIQDLAPDLVHIHSLGPSVLFYLETAKVHAAPLLVTLTSHPPEILVGMQMFKRILGSANWVTAKSTAALSRARKLVPEIIPRSSSISNLKRGFEISRCLWKGWEHFCSKVMWSVLGYNIRVLTKLVFNQLPET